jgi:uncharacterized membrane protein
MISRKEFLDADASASAPWKQDESREKEKARSVNVGKAERWGSAVAGAALAAFGIYRRSLPGALLALAGGSLIYRAATGHCYVYESLGIRTAEGPGDDTGNTLSTNGVRIEKTVTIHRPPREVYAFWRNLENLPRFLQHVESVQTKDGGRLSRWVVRGPFGTTFEWEAEIINDQVNELIAWRTLEGSEVDHAGSVHFRAAGDDETEVRVNLKYNPSSGSLGIAVAKLFGQDPGRDLERDLQNLQQLLETGEIASREEA